MDDTIYTRDEASHIVDLFEEILFKNHIRIPSGYDDERDPHDEGLYGDTYSELLDNVEYILASMLETPGRPVVTNFYSGKG